MKNKYKKILIATILLTFVIISNLNFISAADWWEGDNYKFYDKDIGEYGKVTIFDKSLFGEDNPLQEIELKTNTPTCSNNCKAEIDSELFEDSAVIESIRFIDIRTGQKTNIKNYNILVDGKEYELGEELKKGIKDIEIVGELYPFQIVDWQIKINGFWIEEYALWEDSLNTNLISFHSFEEGSGFEALNSVDNNIYVLNITSSSSLPNWVTGKVGTGIDLEGSGGDSVYLDSLSIYEALNNKNFTFSIWLNVESFPVSSRIFTFKDASTDILKAEFQTTGTNLAWTIDGVTDHDITIVAANWIGNWRHVVFQYNGSHVGVWINGTWQGSTAETASVDITTPNHFGTNEDVPGSAVADYDGIMDEIAIWNRTLTQAEIVNYYNGADPPAYLEQGINLLSPTNNSFSIDDPIEFSVNVTPSSGELTNATLFVWDSLNNVVDKTINQMSGSVVNTTNFSISNLPLGQLHWNVLGCSNDSTATTCGFSNNNFTLNYGFKVNSQTFNSETTEGNIEDYQANLTIISGSSISDIKFVYDGEESSGDGETIAGDFILSKLNFRIPTVNATQNKTFYWSLTSNTGKIFNLTTQTQTINNIEFGNCTAFTTQVLNFTVIDEKEQTVLSNNTIELAANIFSSDRVINLFNFSSSFNNTVPVGLCFNGTFSNTSRYSLDSIVKYVSPGRAIEYYNIVNLTITNDTAIQNIFLFDLLNVDSTEFQLTFTGRDFLPAEDVLVHVERQYISENIFKTVELPKTDTNGQTIIHLVRNDILYNLIFIKDGIILKTFRDLRAFCFDPTLSACEISLNALSDEEALPIYDNEIGIAYDAPPTYNETSNIISFAYVSTDGSVKNVTMDVERRDVFGNISICSNSILSISGTLSCNIGGLTDTSLLTIISVDGNDKIFSVVAIDTSAYGNFGYVAWFFITIGLVLVFSKDKNGILIALLLSYIGSVGLGIIVGGVIGVGSAGIWIAIITIVGLWQLNKNKPD